MSESHRSSCCKTVSGERVQRIKGKERRTMYTRGRSKTREWVWVYRNLVETNEAERRMERREKGRERERAERVDVKSKKGEEEIKGEDRVMYCGKCSLKTMSCNKRSRLYCE